MSFVVSDGGQLSLSRRNQLTRKLTNWPGGGRLRLSRHISHYSLSFTIRLLPPEVYYVSAFDPGPGLEDKFLECG